MTRFKKRKLRSDDDGAARIIIALLVGAGGAFLLAIVMLASRLSDASDEGTRSAPGLVRGIVTAGIAGGALEDGIFAASVINGGVAEFALDAVVGKQQPPDEPLLPTAQTPDRLSFPPLPPNLIAEEVYGEVIISNLLNQNQPTIAGIIALLQRFLYKFHSLLVKHRDEASPMLVVQDYIALVDEVLGPFELAYRDAPIFPIREDGSIFMSLGAYRDHLLGETLRQAYKNAAYPDKLFVGAVVQNCFGIDVQCKTGVEVKGMDEKGRPITAISDKGPDVNGIEEFCTDPVYSKYCSAGQIRVLYVNETESNGPCQARYFASKLWGGETYYMQSDAHLRYAPEWDRLYHEEMLASRSYPKSILSSYPPNFQDGDPPYLGGSRGARLCSCEFTNAGQTKHGIIRIDTGHDCRKEGELQVPYQAAYIAAGFFFTRAEFLTDVPFDPYLPWVFMGEEIALSIRAWTHGWSIYAPRFNYIAHQYRPGSMGLPK